MSQVALFDLIAEHDTGEGLTREGLEAIIIQLAGRKINDSQRLGEALLVTSTRFDETSALMIVSGAHTRRIYGEVRLQGDVSDVVALDYALTIVLNGQVTTDKIEQLIAHLRSDSDASQGLSDEQSKLRDESREQLAAHLSSHLAQRLPQPVWTRQLVAEELDDMDIFAAFDRAMLRLRQLPVESQRIGHPLNVTCQIDQFDRIEREVDGERVRARGMQLMLSAGVAGNPFEFGHERLVVLIPESAGDLTEAMADLGRLLVAQLQSALNGHWAAVGRAHYECERCFMETGDYLELLDHTVAGFVRRCCCLSTPAVWVSARLS
jgi:hypothetical protein